MKRILYVLALLSATILVSCEKSSGGGGGGGGGGTSGGGGGTVTVSGSEPYLDQTPRYLIENSEGKYGFIDAKGNVIIPTEYDDAYPFSSGMAQLKKDGVWSFVDQDGKVIGQQPDNLGFDNYVYYNRLRVIDNATALMGSLDQNLEAVVPVKYKGFGLAGRNGYAWFSNDGAKWGYVNLKGEEVIPAQFDNVYMFYGSATVVQVYQENGDTYCGIIDGTGKYLVEPQAKPIFPLGEDVFAYYDGLHYGVWDKNGNELAPAVYDDFWDFFDGLACFEKDGAYGFMNTKAQEVIPASYYNCLDFRGGYNWVQNVEDGDWDLIDTTGKVLYTLTTDEEIAEDQFRCGLTLLTKWVDYSARLATYRYIDTKGNTIYTWTIVLPDTSSSAPKRMGRNAQRRAPREDKSSMSI